ncbi:MAG: hypothetical protein N3H84_02325 [Candidatus Caldarchaeum sp.]|nr:hypothetical protein [Candidatus Caldarchaeum sp.]MCX8200925.1 hypothetical protein [Candidatus Caldarchaeum sp.]MDW8434753.1 hypothetical protein [Candidatus Caldarchaeum sp.]
MKHFEILEKIRSERRRGSTTLAFMVLDAYRALAAEAQNLDAEVPRFAALVEEARPAMPLVARFSREVVKRVDVFSPEKLLAAVDDVEKTYRGMLEQLVTSAVEKLAAYPKITTLSHSGTVSSILRRLKNIQLACVLESRPLREGLLLASELEGHVKVFVDAAMAYAVEECDAVVVGADALFADGSFAGKVGVRPLAYVAKNIGKPFYVVCDTWKQADSFVNEYGPASDVAETHTAENPVFEKVEPEYVTAFLTEKKAASPLDVKALLQQ